MREGKIDAIYITAAKGDAMQSMAQVRAVRGRGLEGDRYFLDTLVPPEDKKAGQQVTLIEIEAVEALAKEQGIDISPVDIRRNLVMRGIALNGLVDKKFRVGEVVMRGIRLCEPCQYLAKRTQPQVLPGLLHRGGLRAEILNDGVIRVGDALEVIQE